MYKYYDYLTVYVFPDGYKRMGLGCSGLELKKLTLAHGIPITTIMSYEEVKKWRELK